MVSFSDQLLEDVAIQQGVERIPLVEVEIDQVLQ